MSTMGERLIDADLAALRKGSEAGERRKANGHASTNGAEKAEEGAY